ncbi:hypothetical protein FRB99_005808 [Tulasnella sp. 403]|nr:hypothetical protein FRB99_005808 [Tulasnella sp. 403]
MSMAQLFFYKFDVTRQAFFRSRHSFGLVNLKPIVPGHVLVVPKRVVPRLSDLTPEEISDLFGSIQKVGLAIERAYSAQSLTVACQDGPAAGQSVPHVHVHILPRKWEDFGGHNDRVYPAIDENETALPEDLVKAHKLRQTKPQELHIDNEGREPRSIEEMEKEASWLTSFFSDES